ncbi:hypothetical protein BV22DRAFT_1041674 [Leucogyrophana mollusca]|uniref:Uncharacterized protein n=1 Tax=Leucogyrophana mollusca TaxID=85980 RepID=A0ACB8B018_9AGAM|nr:hypothetical protein BV22DRAFT_1041674 [Leucogyrophana mollusca]
MSSLIHNMKNAFHSDSTLFSSTSTINSLSHYHRSGKRSRVAGGCSQCRGKVQMDVFGPAFMAAWDECEDLIRHLDAYQAGQTTAPLENRGKQKESLIPREEDRVPRIDMLSLVNVPLVFCIVCYFCLFLGLMTLFVLFLALTRYLLC